MNGVKQKAWTAVFLMAIAIPVSALGLALTYSLFRLAGWLVVDVLKWGGG